MHTALNALNCPADGCVTTTFAAENTFPPPAGTELASPSTLPPLPPPAAAADEALPEAGVPPAAAAVAVVPDGVLAAVVPLLELLLQAARAAVTPARPVPASIARRVVPVSCGVSWATVKCLLHW